MKSIEGKNEQKLESIGYQEKRLLDAIKNHTTKKESFKELEFPVIKMKRQKKSLVRLQRRIKKLI